MLARDFAGARIARLYFQSLAFAVLLATVVLLDHAVAKLFRGAVSWRVRCTVFLAASLVFYGWWNPGGEPPAVLAGLGVVGAAAWRVRFLALLVASITVDWWLSRKLDEETRPGRRKAWLATSITMQLGILSTFKYWNFARDTLQAAAPGSALAELLPKSDLALPVGISFYTFQSMSYTIDVYRRVIPSERRFATLALFVTFFPQLVAGPIVRAKDFLWQLQTPKRPKITRILTGAERFAIGLFKKTVIADNLTPLTDQVFNAPEKFSGVNHAAALAMWAVVIYCDFSGYSDMAIGCARMLGFKFLENFHFPYLARSVAEFWRRWHISLSEWLRDYLYIPLGGSRHGPLRTMFALTATMLLGGLWHGASWNFVIWGAWWGLWLAIAHGWRHVPKTWHRLTPVWVAMPATLAIAVLGWAPFRCKDLGATTTMLGGIFSPDLIASWSRLQFIKLSEFAVLRSEVVGAAIALAAVTGGMAWGHFSGAARLDRRDRSPPTARFPRFWYGSRSAVLRGAVLALFLGAIALLRQTQNDAFIYFQF